MNYRKIYESVKLDEELLQEFNFKKAAAVGLMGLGLISGAFAKENKSLTKQGIFNDYENGKAVVAIAETDNQYGVYAERIQSTKMCNFYFVHGKEKFFIARGVPDNNSSSLMQYKNKDSMNLFNNEKDFNDALVRAYKLAMSD
jgi:hypothetical protein